MPEAIPDSIKAADLPPLKHALADGHYGGVITLPDGRLVAVVKLDAKPPRHTGADAMRKWAKGLGAQLITRAIGSLLVSTMGDMLPKEVVWTEEDFAPDTAFAWCCGLLHGYVTYYRRRASAGGVAVRLIPLVL